MKEQIKDFLEQKKLNELKKMLGDTLPADIAIIMEDLTEAELVILFRLLSKETGAETFAYMDSHLQMLLVKSLTDEELREVLAQTYVDDTVDMIEEIPANVVSKILKNTDAETRTQINQILNYPKDSAGSIMTTEYINLKGSVNVLEAIKIIRKIGVKKETIYTCYVTENRKLIGLVSVKDILISNDEELLSSIMETKVISVHTHDDKEDVAKKFSKYGFLAMPVVDSEGFLVGIVTVDDAIDVMQDENTEDFSKMAAVSPSDEPYFKTSVFNHAKNRIGWLLVLMLSASITGSIITKYEHAFSTIPLLVSFIPMLMDTGGNCGSQSSTLIIRGLALDEIKMTDLFKVVFKEFRISVIVSIVLALVNGIRIFIVYNDIKMAIVVGLSLAGTVILSKLIGCTLPIFAKKVKMDPAIMAAPLITTIVDAFSIFLYFNIAMRFFNL